MSAQVRVRCPAKINLFLRVVGRRPDGYHDLETVFQALDLSDDLTLTEAGGEDRLACNVPGVPTDARNLVLKAAALLRRDFGLPASRSVVGQLEKRIPMQAGMAGGSTDGAGALLGLAALWGLDVPEERLRVLALELGSDVPFFLQGGAALGYGRGERLTALRSLEGVWALVIKPQCSVSTPWAFSHWRPEETVGPPVEECLAAIERGDLPALAASLRNDLEPAVTAEYPEIETARRRLLDLGALGARMTGTGSAMFGLMPDEAAARAAAADLDGGSETFFLTRFYAGGASLQ